LEELERAAEAETLRKQQAAWQAAKAARQAAGDAAGEEEEEEEEGGDGAGGAGDGASEGFLMELPDRAAIERAILDRKKKEMLAMLTGGQGAPPETHTPDLVPKSW
jgi:hypothetical protein